MASIYKSKLGLELIIPIGLIFGYALFELISNKVWMGILIMVLTLFFILYTLLSIKYTIENDKLTINCTALMTINIEINSIRKVVETYNPLSSPAASIDRLELFYNKFDSVLISPKNKKEFIYKLLEINPAIEIIYRKS